MKSYRNENYLDQIKNENKIKTPSREATKAAFRRFIALLYQVRIQEIYQQCQRILKRNNNVNTKKVKDDNNEEEKLMKQKTNTSMDHKTKLDL